MIIVNLKELGQNIVLLTGLKIIVMLRKAGEVIMKQEVNQRLVHFGYQTFQIPPVEICLADTLWQLKKLKAIM